MSASVRSGVFLSLFLGARRAATPAPSAPSAGADVITPPGVTSVLLRPTDPCEVQKWLDDEEVDVACRGEFARELAAVVVVDGSGVVPGTWRCAGRLFELAASVGVGAATVALASRALVVGASSEETEGVVSIAVFRGAAVGASRGGGTSSSPPLGGRPGGLTARGYPQACPPPSGAPLGGSAADSSSDSPSRGPAVVTVGGSHWRMLAPCVAQNLPRPPAGLPRPLAIPAALPLNPSLPPAAW